MSKSDTRIVAVVGAGFSLLLASCQTTAEQQGGGTEPVTAISKSEGGVLSEALCSDCHAIEIGGISANPQAPTFEEIANREGLSQATLGNFLHDSYNFPNQMNVELSDKDSDAISAYIVSLRSGNSGAGKR